MFDLFFLVLSCKIVFVDQTLIIFKSRLIDKLAALK